MHSASVAEPETALAAPSRTPAAGPGPPLALHQLSQLRAGGTTVLIGERGSEPRRELLGQRGALQRLERGPAFHEPAEHEILVLGELRVQRRRVHGRVSRRRALGHGGRAARILAHVAITLTMPTR